VTRAPAEIFDGRWQERAYSPQESWLCQSWCWRLHPWRYSLRVWLCELCKNDVLTQFKKPLPKKLFSERKTVDWVITRGYTMLQSDR
jgi:hypothetical protein